VPDRPTGGKEKVRGKIVLRQADLNPSGRKLTTKEHIESSAGEKREGDRHGRAC